MKKLLTMFVLTLIAVSSFAETLPKVVSITNNGILYIAKSRIVIQALDNNWKTIGNLAWKNFEKDGTNFTADMVIGDKTGKVKYNIIPVTKNSFDVDFNVTFDNPVELKALQATLIAPIAGQSLAVDEESITIPESFANLSLKNKHNATSVTLTQANGIQILVESELLNVVVQDNRKYNSKDFSVRIMATPNKGEISSASLKFRVTIKYTK